MNRFEDNSLSIGRKPLVRLNRLTGGAPAAVLAKREERDPACPVKCRVGAAMVRDDETRGFPITFAMPETMGIERRKLLAACGAKLVPTEGAKGTAGAGRS